MAPTLTVSIPLSAVTRQPHLTSLVVSLPLQIVTYCSATSLQVLARWLNALDILPSGKFW